MVKMKPIAHSIIEELVKMIYWLMKTSVYLHQLAFQKNVPIEEF